MSFRFDRIDRDLSDSARLEVSAAERFFKVILPLTIKDVSACMLLIFALAMGEYAIVILITPPGFQMITVKIYNYIHYGASEIVFALNMTIFFTVIAAGAILMRIYREERGKKQNDQ